MFKRLLSLWTRTWYKKKGRKHKLGALDLNRFDTRLSKIRKSYPKEFHQILKSIYKVRQMKAVELRALLFPPYVFKGMINMFFKFKVNNTNINGNSVGEAVQTFPIVACWNNNSGITKLYRTHNEVADNYLRFFVYEFGKLHGKNHLIYNVNSLIHLASDCLVLSNVQTRFIFPSMGNYCQFLFSHISLIRTKYSLPSLVSLYIKLKGCTLYL